jgi:hypothetical protein
MSKVIPALILLIIFSCKAQQQKHSLQVISEKIGDNAIIDYNQDRSFALVQEKFTVVQDAEYTSSFLIIRMSDNKIIKEGKVVHGYIKWINDDIIETFEMPGVIKDGQEEEDFKKRINIRNFQKDKNKK